ncbi:MAG TPA: hypothetical protein VN541_07140 [Tepidisphaeraceae bacterium]|nr:hypothetical protein [Tepidisphaeraceae bacterium]
MSVVDFNAELNESGTLTIPPDVAAQLPKSGRVRVIVVTDIEADDRTWLEGAYQQFLSDCSPEDEIYQSLH